MSHTLTDSDQQADQATQTTESRKSETHADWCRKCCTQHPPKGRCPGALLATGVERHGWRIVAETTWGSQVFGVLVAPVRNLWRARIITYPNVLWVIPKAGSMKFLGGSAADAEKKAIAFIREHCKIRGFKTAAEAEAPPVRSKPINLEQDASTAESEKVQSQQRQLRQLRIRWGAGRPTQHATTDNLSESGLFIRTNKPLSKGTQLRMQIEIEQFEIPLRGTVQWAREKNEVGRLAGMGVMLHRPHPRYVHFVRQEREEQKGVEESYDAASECPPSPQSR